MFRFSMEKGVQYDTNERQLYTADIASDEDWGERLKGTGEYREEETYYRAENMQPNSVEQAVQFVQGIFFRAPNRVWIGGEGHEVTAEMVNRILKP